MAILHLIYLPEKNPSSPIVPVPSLNIVLCLGPCCIPWTRLQSKIGLLCCRYQPTCSQTPDSFLSYSCLLTLPSTLHTCAAISSKRTHSFWLIHSAISSLQLYIQGMVLPSALNLSGKQDPRSLSTPSTEAFSFILPTEEYLWPTKPGFKIMLVIIDTPE